MIVKRGSGSILFTALGILSLGVVWVFLWLFSGHSIIPSPWETVLQTLSMLSDAYTWEQLFVTLMRVGAGFLLAFVAGATVGILAGKVKALEHFFRPATLFLQGIPPLLWVIPLILLFGIGHLSPILVIALICFPLAAVNIAEGMKTVPGELEEMVEIFAPGAFPKLREVVIPHLHPFFSATLDLGFALGLKASVVGEFFGANNGIGFQIQAAYQSLQTRRLFAWGLVLVGLIILSSRLFSRIEGIAKALRKPPAGARATRRPAGNADQLYKVSRRTSPVKLRGIAFAYPGSKPLFEGIDLTIEPDEVAVISGESGVGKSTFLKIIAGILEPSRGDVERPSRVGFVFQDDRLIPWQTLQGNIALPLNYLGYARRDSGAIAKGLLAEFGLDGEGEKYPDALSGGMRKRAAFARCLARIPSAVLLDEPFAGLHKEARSALWKRFLHILDQHPVPVIVVTHYPEELVPRSRLSFYTLRGKPAALLGETA